SYELKENKKPCCRAAHIKTNSLLVTCCLLLIFFIILPSLSVLSFASTPEPPAVPPDYVVDLAGIIGDDMKQQLDGYLRELEQKTTAQMVILTVQSLDGENIEEFSIRTVERWKLGQKGKDNGVLMTVALKDRKYRFEIGYGLEGVLPDSLVGSIGRQYVVPNFKRGDYSAGIFGATLVIIRTIAAHEGVTIAGMPADERDYVGRGHGGGIYEIGLFRGIILLVFLIAVIMLIIRHPGLCLLLFFSSGRGGWSGGGGGSGGFGGGGGGFGGGGASGGW
ncbi:MAG: TPM domain-containing protein, partial [Nitrospirae bacterium]|nr:TPM domain-containing protein [Nitrospirota bacterium]